MEYAKDEIFKIRYNEKLNCLQMEKKRKTSKLISLIKKHKLMSMTMIAFLLFSMINIMMIISFMKILQNL